VVTKTENNHDWYVSTILWCIGTDGPAIGLEAISQGVGYLATTNFTIDGTFTPPHKVRSKLLKKMNDRTNDAFERQYSSYRRGPPTFTGAVGWGASFVPFKSGRISRPFFKFGATTSLFEGESQILLQGIIERWNTATTRYAQRETANSSCVCGRKEDAGHILAGLPFHHRTDHVHIALTQVVRERHTMTVNALSEAIGKCGGIIITLEGLTTNCADESKNRDVARMIREIEKIVSDSGLKPDIVVLAPKAGRYDAFIVDPTVTTEAQLRSENAHYTEAFALAQRKAHAFKIDGSLREPRDLQLNIHERFYHSTYQGKIAKYERLRTQIGTVLQPLGGPTATHIIPIIFGSLGGLHVRTIEALAHHPFTKADYYDHTLGSPSMPKKTPGVVHKIVKVILKKAVTCYKRWVKCRSIIPL
jgi:hypothetical protein